MKPKKSDQLGPKFLLDGMLGTLARWLRICGYDAAYVRSVPDKELVERALKENRVLLTRDKLLYRKAVRSGVEALLVEGESDVDRLSFLTSRLDIGLDPEQSRCPKCGGLLEDVEKEAVKGRVPQRTYDAYNEFYACGSCGQVYWKGSHWRSIVNTLKRAAEHAPSASGGAENSL